MALCSNLRVCLFSLIMNRIRKRCRTTHRHELFELMSIPQPPFKFKPAMDRMVSFLQAFEECDALVTSSSRSVEGAAFEWIEAWLSKSKAPVFGVGPLLPAIDESASQPSKLGHFLDHIQAERGAQTLLFVWRIDVDLCLDTDFCSRYPSAPLSILSNQTSFTRS